MTRCLRIALEYLQIKKKMSWRMQRLTNIENARQDKRISLHSIINLQLCFRISIDFILTILHVCFYEPYANPDLISNMAKLQGAVCDTRCQLFHNEMAKKENSLRMKWFVKNRQRLIENLGSEKLVSKAQMLMAENEEKRRQFYREQRSNVRVTPKLPEWRPANSMETVNLNPMRPVDPVIKSIIYERSVPSFITGNNYLQKRLQEMPEDRYYFPDCASWTYGWRMKDYPPLPTTKVGIRSVIQATFYRRNASSLQRDPDWYRNCQTGDAKNFNENSSY